MAEEKRRKQMEEIRSERSGRLLCRFDPERDRMEFKEPGKAPEFVDLGKYRGKKPKDN
jgi:hypothetical protein